MAGRQRERRRPLIAVVGLGPAGPEHLTARALELVDSASREAVFLRTTRHPAAPAVLERRDDVRWFDDAYEKAGSFEEVYEAIVTALLEAATRRDSAAEGPPLVCYAVPGSPTVAERTVELLRERAPDAGLDLVVEPGVSYLDLAWDRLALDPLAAGVLLADASGFARAAAGGSRAMLLAQVWSRQVLSDVKLALEEPSPDQRATILHHLGLPDEDVVEVAWADLDRTLEPDHLTSVFVPLDSPAPASAVASVAETVATLRQRCPWDREQTHVSLVRHLLEETYEAIEAIESLGDDPAAASPAVAAHVEEELGDLLCQVLFHATLAAEEGLFTLADVARTLEQKLVSRHPHVFAAAHAATSDDVVRNWERSKDEQKGRAHLLEGIPAAMPALARAEKVERKLRSIGLGWERSGWGEEELLARLAELRERLAAPDGPGARVEAPDPGGGAGVGAAAGDVLLALARYCADRRLDPEAALRGALNRLAGRVQELETAAAAGGATLAEWVAGRAGELPVHEQQAPLC